jgi:hypothetical protein
MQLGDFTEQCVLKAAPTRYAGPIRNRRSNLILRYSARPEFEDEDEAPRAKRATPLAR